MSVWFKAGIFVLILNEVRAFIFLVKDGPLMVKTAFNGDISGLYPIVIDLPFFIIMGVVAYFVKKSIDLPMKSLYKRFIRTGDSL